MAEQDCQNCSENIQKRFARTILPDIIAFFETEEGNRQYEEWLKKEGSKEKTCKDER